MKYFEVNYLFKGQKTKTVVKSPTRNDAISIAKLKIPGVILNIKETSAPLEDQLGELKDQIMNALFRKKIKMPNLIAAMRQLSVMTNAGISIHDSVKEVANATVDKTLKEIFNSVNDDLNSGLSLTQSLMTYRNEVGDVTLAMVELGESTGNMAESLEKLSEILEEIEENRQKFKKAMRYPITVVIAIAVAFSILMIYVVPKFKEIFAQLKAELPLPTKILLFMENLINHYGLYLLSGIIGTILLFQYLLKNNEDFKKKFDIYILKVYLIGNIIFYATLSRFCLVFTELIRAGIPIADALDTALLTLENTHLKKKLSSVKISVQRGISLTESFRDTGLFEGMLIQMIQAGEQSGTLDKMLEKVTLYFKSRFSQIIDNIASYIEPILLGFIAAMVLLMALGIFMPMWDMAKAVKS
ncbi:type II secretion system F family protein [Sulfurospirillum diekertiae]|uniref:Type II secretion system F family protein n=1 Tax=Sulfurospirillum diekertiae TaxID=1854492 RepID=A0A1Y0HKU3_9BACT|nr:type II secretion system F family protein [Sulfurospirillum diekertiae]ARU48698.1 Type II secretion system protein F [Sulfurospirillum diekertiae]ASC93527.1 Type II secretion system protein F [Sulfurospirillum diekertiae]QIR77219.1 type II secretion system F family protein [Sulfurospirillum diekertiae]QIR79833.1 type II secretion system F family protein [Sulfurospirillum diekertiae]